MSAALRPMAELPSDVLLRELDGEAVLLHLPSGMYFGLDPIGLDVVRTTMRVSTLRATLDDLEERYDAPRDVLERDVTTLLAELGAEGLLRIAEARTP